MMKGQLHEEQNDTYEAQQAYRSGVWLFFILSLSLLVK